MGEFLTPAANKKRQSLANATYQTQLGNFGDLSSRYPSSAMIVELWKMVDDQRDVQCGNARDSETSLDREGERRRRGIKAVKAGGRRGCWRLWVVGTGISRVQP